MGLQFLTSALSTTATWSVPGVQDGRKKPARVATVDSSEQRPIPFLHRKLTENSSIIELVARGARNPMAFCSQLLLLLLFLLALTGCEGSSVAPPGLVTEFPIPTAQSDPSEITAGPDGNLWFTEFAVNRIGRITPSGRITEFTLPPPTSALGKSRSNGPIPTSATDGITAGPDGNVWFTEAYDNCIGRITPSGQVTIFPIPTPNGSPADIIADLHKTLWFLESGSGDTPPAQIGRMTLTGQITLFATPTPHSDPAQIALGPDGNLWFTEDAANQIGRITPSGKITEFPLSSANAGLAGISAGPDGNLWFTESNANQIGRITPTGQVKEFSLPTVNAGLAEITAGPDGNLWFAEFGGFSNGSGQIRRITPTGKVTEFPMLTSSSRPFWITAGPEGNLWFTDGGTQGSNQIGRITSR